MAAKDPPVLKSMRAKRILIVDDYPAFVRSIASRMHYAGFEYVEVAHDKETAWEKLGNFKPEVLLIDIDLGEKSDDGLVILGEMRRQGFDGLGAIVSGDDSIYQLHRALDVGADDYWCKGPYLKIVFEMVELLSRPPRPASGEWAPEQLLQLGYFRTKGISPADLNVVLEYARDFPRYHVLAKRMGRSQKQLRKVMSKVQEQLGVKGQGQLSSLLTVCEIMGKRSRR